MEARYTDLKAGALREWIDASRRFYDAKRLRFSYAEDRIESAFRWVWILGALSRSWCLASFLAKGIRKKVMRAAGAKRSAVIYIACQRVKLLLALELRRKPEWYLEAASLLAAQEERAGSLPRDTRRHLQHAQALLIHILIQYSLATWQASWDVEPVCAAMRAARRVSLENEHPTLALLRTRADSPWHLFTMLSEHVSVSTRGQRRSLAGLVAQLYYCHAIFAGLTSTQEPVVGDGRAEFAENIGYLSSLFSFPGMIFANDVLVLGDSPDERGRSEKDGEETDVEGIALSLARLNRAVTGFLESPFPANKEELLLLIKMISTDAARVASFVGRN